MLNNQLLDLQRSGITIPFQRSVCIFLSQHTALVELYVLYLIGQVTILFTSWKELELTLTVSFSFQISTPDVKFKPDRQAFKII